MSSTTAVGGPHRAPLLRRERGPSPAAQYAGLWRVLRVLALTLLLCGSLLPPVAGVGVHVIASLVVAPLVVCELGRFLPRVAPVVVAVLVIFVPLLIGGWLNPPTTEYGVEKWSSFTTSSLLSAAAVALIRDARHLLTFAKTWASVSVLLAATTLLQSGVVERAGGYAESPIWMGRALALGVVSVFWLTWHRRLPRPVGFAAAGFFILAMVATGSRGPFLGMVAAVLVLSLVIARGRLRRALALVLAGFLTLALAPSIERIRDSRLYQVFQTLGEGRSDQIREEMWRRSLRLMREEPSGVGVGSWRWEAPSPTHHQYPHNLFFEVATEMGVVIGALLLLTLLVVLIRLAWLAPRHPGAALVLGLVVSEGLAVSVSGDMTARTFFAMTTLGLAVVLWGRYSRAQAPGAAAGDLWADDLPARRDHQPLKSR